MLCFINLKKINIICKKWPTYLFALLFLAVNMLSFKLMAANNLFMINITPATVYQKPDKNSGQITSLYKVNDIKIINLVNKWAQIEFVHEQENFVGWVEKSYLKLQHTDVQETEDSQQETLVAQELNPNKKETFVLESVADKIQCVQAKETKTIDGCFVNIDVTLKSEPSVQLAEVRCIAEFELNSRTSKKVLKEKKIRTPVKSGVAGARLQVTIVPLFERNIKSIKLVSHKCYGRQVI